jgi:transposase InsO family protein
MLIALAVLAVAATQVEAATPFNFSRGYVVWAGSDGGRCNYFMTDAGESAKQLTDTLRNNYPPSAGIEILTDKYTPDGCATIGARAARRAGFQHVRIRPGTDKDRSPGIP